MFTCRNSQADQASIENTPKVHLLATDYMFCARVWYMDRSSAAILHHGNAPMTFS